MLITVEVGAEVYLVAIRYTDRYSGQAFLAPCPALSRERQSFARSPRLAENSSPPRGRRTFSGMFYQPGDGPFGRVSSAKTTIMTATPIVATPGYGACFGLRTRGREAAFLWT